MNYDKMNKETEMHFSTPKRYDNWFLNMEREVIPEAIAGKNIIYRFAIAGCSYDEYCRNESSQQDKIVYRNARIREGLCKVSSLPTEHFDLEIWIEEEELSNIIHGGISLFDSYLSRRLSYVGDVTYFYLLPQLFSQAIFPNRDLTCLTPENVFINMHQQTDIPDILKGKCLCFNLYGAEGGKYYIQIEDQRFYSTQVLPTRIDFVISMPSNVFLESCFEGFDLMEAYQEGSITYRGNMSLGLEFENLLAPFKFPQDLTVDA